MLITNVSIFDGTSEALITGKDVATKGRMIDKLVDAGGDGSGYDQVIDGGGRILIPGLIESHAHLTWASIPMTDLQNSLPGYEQVVATAQAKNMLMRGVTSVRDMGGLDPRYATRRQWRGLERLRCFGQPDIRLPPWWSAGNDPGGRRVFIRRRRCPG